MTEYTNRDKREQCRNIINFLHGFTGDNFEKQMCRVLKRYYSARDKTFEPVEAFRGDYKNDGWVKEDAIFYAIFAPFTDKGNEAVQTSIENKFKADLEGLLKNLASGHWNGKISSFIFIVNMRDKDLPPNPKDFFNNTVDALKNEYRAKFTFKVIRPDDLLDDLHDALSDNDITKILLDLGIEISKLQEVIHEKDILSFIEAIGAEIIKDSIDSTKTIVFDNNRISPDKKIKLNELDNKADEINSILSKIYVVDNVVKRLSDRLEGDKFNRIQQKTLSKYKELTKSTYNSVEVYNACITHLATYATNKDMARGCAKYIIVYLFEQCDLFEKEKT